MIATVLVWSWLLMCAYFQFVCMCVLMRIYLYVLKWVTCNRVGLMVHSAHQLLADHQRCTSYTEILKWKYHEIQCNAENEPLCETTCMPVHPICISQPILFLCATVASFFFFLENREVGFSYFLKLHDPLL